jgi:Fe2+ or Zn2+ uptake regulation protein
MSDAECFARINRRCQLVVDLIHQAQESTNPKRAAHLYREAREQTEAISGTVRRKLTLMTEEGRANAA